LSVKKSSGFICRREKVVAIKIRLRGLKTLVLFIVLFPVSLFSQNKDTVALKYAEYISTESLKKNLSIIASDEYEGRETGTRGQKLAADYIAGQFRLSGIPPLKNNTYFQEFLLNEKRPGEITFFIAGREYTANKDFYSFSGDVKNKKLTANKVLFLGYGIEYKNYNDYKNENQYDKYNNLIRDKQFDLYSEIQNPKTIFTYNFSINAKIKIHYYIYYYIIYIFYSRKQRK